MKEKIDLNNTLQVIKYYLSLSYLSHLLYFQHSMLKVFFLLNTREAVMRMLSALTAASIQYLSYRYLGIGKYVYVYASYLCAF